MEQFGYGYKYFQMPEIIEGKYSWEYEMDEYRNLFPFLGKLRLSGWIGTAVFLVLYFLQDGYKRSAVILPLIIGLMITAMPIIIHYVKAFRSGGKQLFRYQMDETGVELSREGGGPRRFEFDKISGGVIRERYDVIELRGPGGALPVYVPNDYIDFVKGFILDRTPEETEFKEIK